MAQAHRRNALIRQLSKIFWHSCSCFGAPNLILRDCLNASENPLACNIRNQPLQGNRELGSRNAAAGKILSFANKPYTSNNNGDMKRHAQIVAEGARRRATALLVAVSSGLLSAMFGASAAAEPQDDWPMSRGGPALTGYSPAPLPGSLSLFWTYKTGGEIKSSAAIANGRVFIGSNDKSLHAIDLKTGKKLWAFATEGEIESSPLVLNGMVYFGSNDDFLYAVDAATGVLKWKYKTEGKVAGGPNWFVLKGRTNILIGSWDNRLHCVDAATGQSNWVYETGNYINGTPTVDNGRALFGGCDAILHVVSLANGQAIKTIDAGAYVPGSAPISGSRIFLALAENKVVCIDVEKGTNLWTFKERAFGYFSSPAIAQNRLLVGGRDKRLHCLDAESGRKIWEFATQARVDSSPVVCADKVVFGSDDGKLYIVSLETGREIWSYETGQAVASSPAVAQGRIVIGCDDGRVYCFGPAQKDSIR